MTKRTARLVKQKRGLTLDISLGGTPQPNALTFQDLKASPLKLPFPLPSQSVAVAVVVHVLEYLEPAQWFKWWDELHRVMKPQGMVYCSGPYGGDESVGWLSDPTHRTRVIEASFSWLDPRVVFYSQHAQAGRKQPKPWVTVSVARVPGAHGTISYNVCLARCEVAQAQALLTQTQKGSAA